MTGIPAAKELRQARELAELRVRREEEDAERIGMVSLFGLGVGGGVSMDEVCFRRGRLRILEGRLQR